MPEVKFLLMVCLGVILLGLGAITIGVLGNILETVTHNCELVQGR